jgi:DNA-binding NtrC family response regulator
MTEDALVLRIACPGLEPLERRIDRALLSIGSDPAADVRLALVAPRWAILRRTSDGLEVRRVGAPGITMLSAGQRVELDGIELALAPRAIETSRGLPVEDLAEPLAAAGSPEEALRALLDGLMQATDAQTGAIVLRREDGYAIPVSRTSGASALPEADMLLSDTVVRDVLEGTTSTLCIGDLGAHARYRSVPSVLALKLRSVLCVPMRIGPRVLGAIYLGKGASAAGFSDAQAADLRVLATMALPLIAQLERAAQTAGASDAIVGDAAAILRVRELVRRIAPSDLSVLVLGETGTGKEVVARAIHAASPRAASPMIALNCAAVPESLLAVELFGCKKGAFTGAIADRKGRIEAAHGSTLFLDEVGDMPVTMQVALLRVLEERKVTRVGENEERAVDFRLIAATSRALEREVEAGRFREDLLYRLREVAITLPPLRERGRDVLLLAQLFLRQAERQLALPSRRFSDAAEGALLAHAWRGHVRELRAVVRRASIMSDGPSIEVPHLSLDARATASELGSLDRPLAQAKDEFIQRYCAAVLDKYDGNREAAAAALEISVRSLYRYL